MVFSFSLLVNIIALVEVFFFLVGGGGKGVRRRSAHTCSQLSIYFHFVSEWVSLVVEGRNQIHG